MSLKPNQVRFPEGLRSRFDHPFVLGSGAMGAVFQARDRRLGRDVAIKLLRFEGDENLLGRFRREISVLAKLRHPHVPILYEAGELPEGPYLIMELLEGKDLGSPRKDLDRVKVVRAIADALSFVHAHGVVHRDIKPANLLESSDGRILLGDFGLASADQSRTLTKTGAVVGTPGFLAPELFHGELAGPASDWWALGVTLYGLIEGELPYTLPQLHALGVSLEARLPRLRRLSWDHPLGVVLARLLDPDPAARADPGPWIQEVLDEVPAWSLGDASPVEPGPDSTQGADLFEDPEPPEPEPRRGGFALRVLGGLFLAFLGGYLGLASIQVPSLPSSKKNAEAGGPTQGDRWLAEFDREWTQDPWLRSPELYLDPKADFTPIPAPREGRGSPVLIPGDPLWFGVALRRTKVLRNLVAKELWKLPWDERPEWAETIDRRLESRSRTPFFADLISLEPSEISEGMPQEELAVYDDRALIPAAPLRKGWMGTAIREWKWFLRGKVEVLRALGQESLPEEYSTRALGALPKELTDNLTFGMFNPDTKLNDWRFRVRTRIDLEKWLAPLRKRWRGVWVALFRALREKPQDRALILAIAESLGRRSNRHLPLSMVLAPTWAVLVGEPQSPEEKLLGWFSALGSRQTVEVLGLGREHHAKRLVENLPLPLPFEDWKLSPAQEERIRSELFEFRIQSLVWIQDLAGLKAELERLGPEPAALPRYTRDLDTWLDLLDLEVKFPGAILSKESLEAWLVVLDQTPRSSEDQLAYKRARARLEEGRRAR